MYKYIMFLKQEKPDMDDLERKVLREMTIFKNIGKKFLTDTLAKTSQDIFAYSFISEHSKHPFFQ